jgi:ABC-2 type transport system permease protein
MRASVYLSLFLLGFRSEIRLFLSIVMRSSFLLLLLFVFSRLWQIVSPGGLSMPQLLWYLLMTELVVLATPRVYRDIERDLNDGTFAVLMQKPLNYGAMRVAESLGFLFGRFPAFAGIGGIGTLIFAGEVTAGLRSPLAMGIGCLLVLLSASVMTISYTIIGLCSVFLRDTRALSMVWDKGVWLFGGMMVPLILYPPWLQEIASWTPFYHILFGVAQIALDGVTLACIHSALTLFEWSVVGIVLIELVQRKIKSDIIGEGG